MRGYLRPKPILTFLCVLECLCPPVSQVPGWLSCEVEAFGWLPALGPWKHPKKNTEIWVKNVVFSEKLIEPTVPHLDGSTVLEEVTLSWKGHVTQASQSEKATGLIGLERGDHRKISKTEKESSWEL